MAPRSGMNTPNRLTVSRFALTALFLAILFSGAPASESLALAVFVAASLTDYLDGRIARRDGLITRFGILMDPLADKILICSAFIAFIERQWMPAWMVALIVARELAITGLRLLAASRNVVLEAERYGKHKTASQIFAIIAILVVASYPQWAQWGAPGAAVFGWPLLGGQPWVKTLAGIAKHVAVALTLYSGLVYLWRNRSLYMDDA